MCPACFATIAWIMAGATTAGGAAVFVAARHRSAQRADRLEEPQTNSEMTDISRMESMPRIVAQEDWEDARQALLVREKELRRELDALAAARRRLPMVAVEKDYLLAGPDGPASLHDLFRGRRQLIIYHFMFAPAWEAGCIGCSMLTDNVGHLAHLHARDTSFALISRAPIDKLIAYRRRMGWSLPWYSSFGTDFNYDMGVTHGENEHHGLSVFLRSGQRVFRTYFTTDRGVDVLNGNFNLLDFTPLGRQERWEDSPEGWPQTEPYVWWRRHDEYDTADNQ